MNAYFFNITKEERENILDKHKHVYDGYVTQYAKPNEQPLYVQDFANDKAGITVNNKGEVGEYRNVKINEDIMSGAKFEPEVNIESEEMEEQLDMIGDGEDDLEHGTFGDDYSEEELEKMDREEYLRVQDKCPHCDGFGTVEGDSEYSIDGIEDCEICGGTGKRSQINQAFHSLRDELESDLFESLQEQVKKTKDMFNRIKNF